MGTPTYRLTSSSLVFDAFYCDEFGQINSDTNTSADNDARKDFHKNKFTSVIPGLANGNVGELSNFTRISLKNQANPAVNSGLIVKQHGCPAAPDLQTTSFFFSSSLIAYWHQLQAAKNPWKVPINLTVFFAVGTELNRHGLRTFFDSLTNMQAIVLISGIEPPKGSARYGVSTSQADLKDALKSIFGMEVEFTIKVLASFSTGYCGLNICLINNLLEVADVERLVIYDCLYLNGADTNTIAAINLLKTKVNTSRFKLIAYKCTQGGNSFADGTKIELHPSLLSLFPGKKGLIENLYYNVLYAYLITHRALTSAFDDNVIAFPNATFQKAFNDLKAVVPRRGTMISDLNTYKFVYGQGVSLSGKTIFNDWIKANQTLLKEFGKFLGSKKDAQSIRGLIWQNALPGWGGGNSDGEENHDLLIPEFGWEYLPY